MRNLLIVFVILHYTHSAIIEPIRRIIGGSDADIADYPSVVSIQYFANHLCGGSILSEVWILTAAHCFGKEDPLINFLTIRAGSSLHKQGGTRHSVESIIRHENFTERYDYDAALLKLKEPLVFNDRIRAIEMIVDKSKPDVEAIVLGWGKSEKDVYLHDRLQKVKLAILANNVCHEVYGDKFTSNMICAQYPYKDSCKGDSGGPLIVNKKLAGIVSWGGPECGDPLHPGVYTDILKIRKWIKDKAGI